MKLILSKVNGNCQHYKIKPIQMNVFDGGTRTERQLQSFSIALAVPKGKVATTFYYDTLEKYHRIFHPLMSVEKSVL